jgi:hypothetical protein
MQVKVDCEVKKIIKIVSHSKNIYICIEVINYKF